MPPATTTRPTTGGTAGAGAGAATENKRSRKGIKRGDARPIYVLYKGDVQDIKLARNAAAVLKLAESDKEWKWMSLVVQDGKPAAAPGNTAPANPGDTPGVA